MNTKLVKLTKLILALILGLMLFATVPTVQADASIGDVNISMNGGKLTVNGGGMDYKDSDSAWTGFIKKYKTFIVGVSGMGAVSMIAFFIFNFLKLGAVSTNPSERAKVLQGLIWSGLAAAGLGAVSIIVGFFYGALQEKKTA